MRTSLNPSGRHKITAKSLQSFFTSDVKGFACTLFCKVTNQILKVLKEDYIVLE